MSLGQGQPEITTYKNYNKNIREPFFEVSDVCELQSNIHKPGGSLKSKLAISSVYIGPAFQILAVALMAPLQWQAVEQSSAN